MDHQSNDSDAAFRLKVRDAFDYVDLTKKNRATANLLTTSRHVHGVVPMSNAFVRTTVQRELEIAVLGYLRNTRLDLDRRHFFFTGTFDDGIVFRDLPVFQKSQIERKVKDAMRQLNLHGIFTFEADVLAKRLPNERERLMLFHCHGICWTYDPDFKHKAVSAVQSQRRTFHNRLGLPGFKLVTRAESLARRGRVNDEGADDQNPESMQRLVRYMLKRLPYAKNRFQRPDGSWTVMYDKGHFTFYDALRMIEYQSLLNPQSHVFAVGDGEDVLRSYRKEIRICLPHSERAKNYLCPVESKRLWKFVFNREALHASRARFTPLVLT